MKNTNAIALGKLSAKSRIKKAGGKKNFNKRMKEIAKLPRTHRKKK